MYQNSLDNLVNDIQTLGWHPASGIRLMICGDFNSQVSEHEGVVGRYTNGGERATDVPRANMILGVAHQLHLRLFSTYHQLGPTRVPWRGALARGDTASLMDHIAVTNTTKCQIQIAQDFPTLTISDHTVIQATVLAPKRDRRQRKHLMENILAQNVQSHKLPANWKPHNPQAFQTELATITPTSLQGLTQACYDTARRHSQPWNAPKTARTALFKGLRAAQDPLTRRAYQICLKAQIRLEKQEQTETQLNKWASGSSWTFSKPHRLPGPLRVPAQINDDPNRAHWSTHLQEHFEQLYTATGHEREAVWSHLAAIHSAAFQPHQTPLKCYAQDIHDIIRNLAPGKAGGLDKIPSQVAKALAHDHRRFLAEEFQKLANSEAHKPASRPDTWNVAQVVMLAKKKGATQLGDHRPISLLPQIQKIYSRWLPSQIAEHADRKIPPTQHGFRSRRQCSEIHHILGRLREEGQEWRASFVVIKLDISKAFDNFFRSAIFKALRTIDCHPRAAWAVARELIGTALHPSLFGICTDRPVPTTRGVRQGAPDSGVLFCLAVSVALQPVLEKWAKLGYGLRVGRAGELTNYLSFADDTLLIASTVDQALTMYADLVETLKSVGLDINEAKSQHITNLPPAHCTRLPGINKTGEGMVVLGRLFDITDSTDRDLVRKESNAWHRYRQLLPVLRQQQPLKHRFRILQACVLQAVLWGSETWIITKKRLTHLRGLHTRMLKGMIRAPGRLQGLTDSERIVEYTRYVRDLLRANDFLLLDQLWAKRVWNWAGHLARVDRSFPVHMWTTYHDLQWWRQQQQDPSGRSGRRHRNWDANTTKWGRPDCYLL